MPTCSSLGVLITTLQVFWAKYQLTCNTMVRSFSLIFICNYTCFIGPYLSTEPATISIQSTRSALQDNGTITLNCTADGGYPPPSSISFIKNGRLISTTSNDQLVISVAANDTHTFGRYKCVVNNSVTTMETSLLIKQKGDKVVDSYSMVYYNTGHI